MDIQIQGLKFLSYLFRAFELISALPLLLGFILFHILLINSTNIFKSRSLSFTERPALKLQHILTLTSTKQCLQSRAAVVRAVNTTMAFSFQASLCSEMASELRSALKCPSGAGSGGAAGGPRDGAGSPYLHYGFSTKSQLHQRPDPATSPPSDVQAQTMNE